MIGQITAVTEGKMVFDAYIQNEDATIYGLDIDDGKVYYWGRTSTKRVKLEEPDEDGNTIKYEHTWGWLPYEP